MFAVHDKERSIIRWAWSMHQDRRDEINRALVDPQWANKQFLVVKNRARADEVVEMFRTLGRRCQGTSGEARVSFDHGKNKR